MPIMGCDAFTKAGATPINELQRLKYGQRIKIGGLIVARQHHIAASAAKTRQRGLTSRTPHSSWFPP